PVDSGDVFLAHFAAQSLPPLPQLKWLGYLSTTSVYGNKEGALVDEDTAVAPTSTRGQRRVLAEQGWLNWGQTRQVPTYIFRLAGIYGAGRNALARVQAGTARRIYKEGQLFSRIHVADIAQILYASMRGVAPHKTRLYNICDDMPAPPQDVIAYAAQTLGLAPPALINYDEADLSVMAKSFYTENKRVDNQRIKDELGVRLLYANYKIGLDDIFQKGDF
ncbi:MAG: NAD-dependent epimerase/dehydratase family protein, partial [Alphaproteobacteria bacterium]|nr:NAD-dependent epimerase/dehydratase family protein [Alphaproteobacteria bacterium]